MGISLAARARMQRVLERANAKQANAKQATIEQSADPTPRAAETVETVETVETTGITAAAPARLSPYDQLLVNRWVSVRLTAEVPGLCWHCRGPFFAGQKFVDVRGDEVVVRFHAQCESEWRQEQEALARRALGLPAIERNSTQETTP
jgi:hypothetical protein